MTHIRTDDTRIEQGDELLAPMQLMREIKASDTALQTTFQARNHIHDVLRGYFASTNSTAYLRVAPNGATTGNYRHTSAKGVVTKFPQFPDLDAGSGDVQAIEMTVMHPGWTKAVVP